jgi:predicted transporter
MENIQQFLSDNPVIYGFFLFLLGLLFLLGAIFDWNWIYGNVSPVNYNLEKIDGIVNFFGRKAGV